MTQEIIVYRNPLEAAMWNGLMSGDAFPYMVGVVVFLTTVVLIGSKIEKLNHDSWFRRNNAYSIFLPSSVLTIFVIWFMS